MYYYSCSHNQPELGLHITFSTRNVAVLLQFAYVTSDQYNTDGLQLGKKAAPLGVSSPALLVALRDAVLQYTINTMRPSLLPCRLSGKHLIGNVVESNMKKKKILIQTSSVMIKLKKQAGMIPNNAICRNSCHVGSAVIRATLLRSQSLGSL